MANQKNCNIVADASLTLVLITSTQAGLVLTLANEKMYSSKWILRQRQVNCLDSVVFRAACSSTGVRLHIRRFQTWAPRRCLGIWLKLM